MYSEQFGLEKLNSSRLMHSFENTQLKQIQSQFINYMNNYKFIEAARLIQHEFKAWFCDKWLEDNKQEIQAGNIDKIKEGIFLLEQLLAMLNPFCPFITDEIKSYFFE